MSDQVSCCLGSYRSTASLRFMTRLSKPTRRRFLLNTGMLAAGWELSCADAVLTQELALTPSCRDGDEPTVRQTEGPFFKPRSPERSDLREPGTGSRRFELSGFVLTRSCRLLHGAAVDLWHADEKGEYDNIGIPISWPCHHRTRRRVPVSHHRAGALHRPYEALSHQGSSAGQPPTEHATLFS